MTDTPTEAPDDLPPEAFARIDEGDDLAFYAMPRLVHHIDEGAIAALGTLYGTLLPDNGVILDLMSSWDSHLPADLQVAEMIGHGMNAEELAANPRLDRWFIQDLNLDRALPFDDNALDAVLCCVGMQYLQHPIEITAEVRRILKPGGLFLVSFSNRCFWTKAVEIWRKLSDHGHNNLVRWYMERAGFAAIESFMPSDGSQGDPLIMVLGRK